MCVCVCVFPRVKWHPASESVPNPPSWKLPSSLSAFPTSKEAYFGRNRPRHQGTTNFFFLCHLVVVLLSSLNLSVPQFSVCKLEMAFATNLPPGVSEGLMSWLPTLDPAEWCLTDSLNSRETEKDRWVASI